MRRFTVAGVLVIVLSTISGVAFAQSAASEPLQLEAKIPLGNVSGRIDHMAADVARHRLFVAELGNNTVGVVDLKARKVLHRMRAVCWSATAMVPSLIARSHFCVNC